MSKKDTLRLGQYETVLYNANLNPMGIPKAVTKALSESFDRVNLYPDVYYSNLKKAIAEYAGTKEEFLVLGNGSCDLLRLYISLLSPKKAKLLAPCHTEYERSLKIFGCEVDYFMLDEEKNFVFDIMEFVPSLDSSIDMIIIGNPNNPTSQIISRDDMETLIEVCKELDIFLIIDEMYIEFAEQYEDLTAVPLANDYENVAVLRSVSKFFAVPGLRLAYAVMNNATNMQIINSTVTPNNISTLTAIACTNMFKDTAYIEESRSQIYTERNLIYSAMSTNKNVKLFKPYGNFMLIKLLNDVTASEVAEHCNTKGLVIRTCSDFKGLDHKYIRFCFMNPKQNDLLVNSIMEKL